MQTERAFIGIDIGGTKISAALYTVVRGASLDPSSPLRGVQRPTPAAQGADAVLAAAESAALDVLAALPGGAVLGAVGVGAAGQIDAQRGVVLDANDNLPGWVGIDIAGRLRSDFNVAVQVDNDVRAMAYGEARCGAGRGVSRGLFMTVGTGIGGALLESGRLVHGAHFSAGELGYLMAGTDGMTVESLASAPAIAAAYAGHSGQQLSLRQITTAASSGDLAAQAVIVAAARALGRTLAPVLVFFDPQVLIVGGGVPQIGVLWWDAFRQALHDSGLRTARSVDLQPARFGANAVQIGAALMAYELLHEGGDILPCESP